MTSAGLSDEQSLEEMLSYCKNVTGVENTIFISTKGNSRLGPSVWLAIDPPDSVDPRGTTASVAIGDGAVVVGDIPPRLLEQVRRFIDANREVLLDYWEYRIDTDALRRRLKSL